MLGAVACMTSKGVQGTRVCRVKAAGQLCGKTTCTCAVLTVGSARPVGTGPEHCLGGIVTSQQCMTTWSSASQCAGCVHAKLVAECLRMLACSLQLSQQQRHILKGLPYWL